MADWKHNLVREAKDQLNRLQDRIQELDPEADFGAWADSIRDRARVEEERFAAGRHPLNADYRSDLKRWYARLELAPGASAEDVRRQFRSLMRKYHPDRFAGDSSNEAVATRLSQDLAVAYEGLLEHLGER